MIFEISLRWIRVTEYWSKIAGEYNLDGSRNISWDREYLDWLFCADWKIGPSTIATDQHTRIWDSSILFTHISYQGGYYGWIKMRSGDRVLLHFGRHRASNTSSWCGRPSMRTNDNVKLQTVPTWPVLIRFWQAGVRLKTLRWGFQTTPSSSKIDQHQPHGKHSDFPRPHSSGYSFARRRLYHISVIKHIYRAPQCVRMRVYTNDVGEIWMIVPWSILTRCR